jgi:hypothetical protein
MICDLQWNTAGIAWLALLIRYENIGPSRLAWLQIFLQLHPQQQRPTVDHHPLDRLTVVVCEFCDGIVQGLHLALARRLGLTGILAHSPIYTGGGRRHVLAVCLVA